MGWVLLTGLGMFFFIQRFWWKQDLAADVNKNKSIKACVKFTPIKPDLNADCCGSTLDKIRLTLESWMRKKRNKTEAEVMSEKVTIKSGREGKQGRRQRECRLSLTFCSVSVLTRWLVFFLFFLWMERLAPTLQNCSTDYSKVHLHVK